MFTVHALGELAVAYPVSGAFYAYSVRFIDPSWGFAMGWNYALNWLVVLPFELTAAGLTIDYWNSSINVGVWITIFLVMVIAINLVGVKGYGEVEFVLGTMKVLAVVGFIIFGIIDNCGGVKSDPRGYIGFQYWSNPGAFANGFRGFCSVFVTASFAFGGTELVGLAAAEAENPRKSLPKATKQVLWRISLFYIISLLIVGTLVPYNSGYLAGNHGSGTKKSPFVTAFVLAGVKGLPSVFNAVITLSVISVANSCTYASSRTILALCERGMGPRILAYVDQRGRPLPALALGLAFGLLAYIGCDPANGQLVFSWLLSISGLSNFFTWGSICFAHIRFRKAWAYNGHTTAELPFQAGFGTWGSWLGLALNILCLIANLYISIDPKGTPAATAASDFFQSYLAVPFVIICWVGYKIYSGKWRLLTPISEIDVDSGRRAFDFGAVLEQEKLERQNWSAPKKFWNFLC